MLGFDEILKILKILVCVCVCVCVVRLLSKNTNGKN
jgi:hypothetical protein